MLEGTSIVLGSPHGTFEGLHEPLGKAVGGGVIRRASDVFDVVTLHELLEFG